MLDLVITLMLFLFFGYLYISKKKSIYEIIIVDKKCPKCKLTFEVLGEDFKIKELGKNACGGTIDIGLRCVRCGFNDVIVIENDSDCSV